MMHDDISWTDRNDGFHSDGYLRIKSKFVVIRMAHYLVWSSEYHTKLDRWRTPCYYHSLHRLFNLILYIV